jgi:effector-binding domain-containing protein
MKDGVGGLVVVTLACACAGGSVEQREASSALTPVAARKANAEPAKEAAPSSYEFRVTEVPASHLMAVHARVSGGPQLSNAIRSGLDKVWAYLERQGKKGGRNVVVYWNFVAEGMDIDAGVQVDAPLPGDGIVVPLTIPGGKAVTTVHLGPFEKLGEASSALHAFCSEHGHPISGPTWEDYVHPADEPSKLRTDVFVLVAK